MDAPRHDESNTISRSGQTRTRAALLLTLKRDGGATAAELAEDLNVTAVAVRKHLDALIDEGLVRVEAVKQSRGRPTLHYFLTAAAAGLFPQGYRQFAVDLLEDFVALHGEAALEQLLVSRNDRLRAGIDADSPRDRIDALVALRNAEGYMASVEEQDGAFVIREYNCPIYDIASRHPAACKCEEVLFRDAIQQPVIREESLIAGDPSCTYVIPKP